MQLRKNHFKSREDKEPGFVLYEYGSLSTPSFVLLMRLKALFIKDNLSWAHSCCKGEARLYPSFVDSQGGFVGPLPTETRKL